MNIRNGNTFEARQERIERLHRHAIDWRQKQYDYRPRRTPAQARAAYKRKVAMQKRQRKELIDTLIVLGLLLATGAVLGLGL